MTTNIVTAGIPGHELTTQEYRLAMAGDGSVALGKYAQSVKPPTTAAKPRPMSQTDYDRRLNELTLQLGSRSAARSALTMERVCLK